MLISFNGSSYFDSNDVIGLSEYTAFLREKSSEDPKVSAKIKVRLKNNDSVEIDAMLISIADVADAINKCQREERSALLEPWTNMAKELYNIYALMAQDGVKVHQI